ncbi:MAG: hypothetical protein ABWY23_07270 [Mycetocola sp.]
MSNAGIPQNPNAQPQAAPYPRQGQQASALADRGVVRQILAGGGVVLSIAVVTNILSTIGNLVFGLQGEQLFGLVWSIFIALVFVVGAGLSALYIAPFARATSTPDLLRRLAISAATGAAALLVLNFIWSVVNGGQYLFQMILSSGIFGSISTGLTYGAFFALGVFVARALPLRPQAFSAPQGYGAQQGYVHPQAQAAGPGSVQPQAPGYVQPQVPVPPQQ